MRIRFGLSWEEPRKGKKKGKRIRCSNHTIYFGDGASDWDRDEFHTKLKEEIRRQFPGKNVIGYCPAPEVWGEMLHDIHLLGTDLKLLKGQAVSLEPATNLPRFPVTKRYYARPIDGDWGKEGFEPGEDDWSILVDEEDVVVRKES